jgi:16S rRNA (cytosine967-C5)-methyltransferase
LAFTTEHNVNNATNPGDGGPRKPGNRTSQPHRGPKKPGRGGPRGERAGRGPGGGGGRGGGGTRDDRPRKGPGGRGDARGPKGRRAAAPGRTGRTGPRGDSRHRPPRSDPKRHVVIELVREQSRRYPDLELVEPDTSRLDPRDAAFAHALYDAVIRRWITLRFLLARHLDAPWGKLKPEAKATLLVGAAQMLFMRSVPPHAAVSESVEWMSQNASKGGAGLVNAVLRKLAADIASRPSDERRGATPDIAAAGVPIRSGAMLDTAAPHATPEFEHNTNDDADDTTNDQTAAPDATAPPEHLGTAAPNEPAAAHPASEDTPAAAPAADLGWNDRQDAVPLDDGRVVTLDAPLLPADPIERLAVATSHPAELLSEWAKHASLRDVRDLAMHGLAHPPVILNTQHARAPLPSEGLSPHTAPGHHVFRGTRTALEGLLADRNDLWVQDPASSLAVQSVIDLEPRLVIDYCAGRGTKTRQLALAFPNAEIIATDIDQPRFKYLERAFADAANVRVTPFDDIREFVDRADLVLIDAPCSNTGVLARRVEARYRVDRDRTDSLTAMQRQLIADTIPLLNRGAPAPGPLPGILYSTCSLDPRENEAQAAWAARWHSFRTSREHRRKPSGGPGRDAEEYSDGSYAVLLT